jgi:hypothetical protein
VLDGWSLGRLRHRDFLGRGVYRANHAADKWHNRIANPGCTHQGVAIPAVNAVITAASEDLQRRWNVEGGWKFYRKCTRLYVFTPHGRP